MTKHCELEIGCDEYGVCYAVANGDPSRCGRPAEPLAIGDRVTVYIPDHMTAPSEAYVIGRMHYGADIVCVATEQAHGMPVAERWCTRIEDAADPTAAMRWRERYLSLYGQHWFLPL